MISETRMAQGEMLIRDIIGSTRHDGCGGRPGTAEPVTGIEGVSSRPVRRIAKCLQDTALRDIDALLQHGVLVKEAAGGRSTS